ncbi:MAG: HEAT repeat domain-containing protein [Planctomycetes bacterium]|nr:HEAT repeat domain-containing protein [Planctomycetota bacterium]
MLARAHTWTVAAAACMAASCLAVRPSLAEDKKPPPTIDELPTPKPYTPKPYDPKPIEVKPYDPDQTPKGYDPDKMPKPKLMTAEDIDKFVQKIQKEQLEREKKQQDQLLKREKEKEKDKEKKGPTSDEEKTSASALHPDEMKDENKPPEIRKAEAQKEIERRFQEAKKAAEAKLKKEEEKKKEGRAEDRKPGSMITSTSEGQHMMDFTGNEKDKKPSGSPYVVDPSKDPKKPQQMIMGTDPKKVSPQVGADGTVKYLPAGGPSAVSNDASEAEKRVNLADGTTKKRGFWDKLFGKKDDSVAAGMLPPTALKAGQVGTANANPTAEANPDPSANTSLVRRLQAELAAKRLDQESAAQNQADPKGKDLPPATVVDLDKEKAGKEGTASAAAEGRTPVTPLDPIQPKGAVAQPDLNAEEIKQLIELRFERGLVARDVVEREWAFRYGATYQRKETIAPLMKEIREQGTLGGMAALGLCAIDPQNREAERLYLDGLNSRDGSLRMACATALGRIHSEEAIKPLARTFKVEKNYRVRKAICESLGMIGGSTATEELKAVLQSKDELDEVRAQAALSLTANGDKTGKERLVNALASPDPTQQLTGLLGLVQSGDPDIAGYLSAALESRHEDVWVAAVQYFPQLGPAQSLPVLRPKLQSNQPEIRRRAALAIGMVGSDEGLPYIDEALRSGSLSERLLAASLFGALQRKEKAPLLIEKLRDPQVGVRKAAALSLAALDAKEALPALMDAARGLRSREELPPALRTAMPDPTEQLVMLDAIRILRGEKDVMVFNTLPDSKNTRWPEFDKQLLSRQADLVKSYQLLDVMSAHGKAVAAVLKDPNGKEFLLRVGEPLAAGFKATELFPGQIENGKVKNPPFVSLMRGDARVTLIVGRDAEVNLGRSAKQ